MYREEKKGKKRDPGRKKKICRCVLCAPKKKRGGGKWLYTYSYINGGKINDNNNKMEKSFFLFFLVFFLVLFPLSCKLKHMIILNVLFLFYSM